MIRSASHVTTHPPPSSVAPAPTSHESRWPLTTTISPGRSRPRISPTTFADSTSGSKCASIFRRTTIRLPRSAMRCSRSASSVVIAAAGIFGASLEYCSAPVCGVRRPPGPTARTSMPMAPWRAARDGPAERNRTVSP